MKVNSLYYGVEELYFILFKKGSVVDNLALALNTLVQEISFYRNVYSRQSSIVSKHIILTLVSRV